MKEKTQPGNEGGIHTFFIPRGPATSARSVNKKEPAQNRCPGKSVTRIDNNPAGSPLVPAPIVVHISLFHAGWERVLPVHVGPCTLSIYLNPGSGVREMKLFAMASEQHVSSHRYTSHIYQATS